MNNDETTISDKLKELCEFIYSDPKDASTTDEQLLEWVKKYKQIHGVPKSEVGAVEWLAGVAVRNFLQQVCFDRGIMHLADKI